MSPENFVYWLNGFFEISGSKTLTEEQVRVLKDHLKLVLTKKTPDITIANPGLVNGIVINPLYRGPEITCSTSDKIDLSKGPVCSTITSTGVSPLTVDGGVVPLTVGPVSFRNDDEDFDLLTKAMSIYP
jgi:hypothetical protein